MAKTLGVVALLLGVEVVVKVRHNTQLTDLYEQLDKAYKDGRIQDVDGYDVTAHCTADLPAGDYPIKRSIGGPINLTLVYYLASKMRSIVSMLFNLVCGGCCLHLTILSACFSGSEQLVCCLLSFMLVSEYSPS